MDGVLWIVLVVVLGGVLFLARLTARGPEDAPRQRAVWMGADVVLLEQALLGLILEQRDEGLENLPELQELARHHAFDMAARNFLSDQDPEGVDHEERRRRLHPDFVGLTKQTVGIFAPDAGQSPESFAREAIKQLEATTNEHDWSAIGLGVAIEGGRGRICLVLGQPWAKLSKRATWQPSTGWEVEGRTSEGTEPMQLEVRLLDSQGKERKESASSQPGWDADRFSLHVSVSDPSSVECLQIHRDGVPGLRRRIK
jgi:hypothetical protein